MAKVFVGAANAACVPDYSQQYLPVTDPPSANATLERELAVAVRGVHEAIKSERASGWYDSVVNSWLDGDYASDAERAEAESPLLSHLQTIQRAVAVYTRQMRGHGDYPEKVLVAVKSTLRDVAAPMFGLTLDRLVRDAAHWCIDAYFDTNRNWHGGEEGRG